MFKDCMKRYFRSLRHLPGVLGVLFLALLIGGSVFLSGSSKALHVMTEDIRTITGQADLSVNRVTDAMLNSLYDMANEGEISEDGNNVISSDEAQDALHQSVEEALSETVENYEKYLTDIAGVVGVAVASILLMAAVYFLIQAFSWLLGRRYVLAAEKSYYARNGGPSFKRKTLHKLPVFVLYVILIGGFFIDNKVGITLLVLFPLLYCVVSLIASGLSAGKENRIPIKEVLRIGNVLCLLGANILQIILTTLFAAAVFYISNIVIAFYVDIALIIIAAATVTMNSDAIVLHLLENKR